MNDVTLNQEEMQNTVENPKGKYNLTESIFAWLCIVGGFLFCRTFPVFQYTLGGFAFVVGLFIVTAIIMKINKAKFGFVPVISMLSAMVVSSGIVLCSNALLQSLCYCYSIAAYLYFLYAVNSSTAKRGVSDMIIVDYFKAFLKLPCRL